MDLSHISFQPLVAKADAAVAAAFDAVPRRDPVLGGLAQVHAVAMALTRMHGSILEDAVAAALRHSGRYDVSQGVRFPITEAARHVVSSNSPDLLPRVRLSFDSEAVSTIDLDLAAVSIDGGGRAVAVDLKRSVAAMSGGKRAALERELLAVSLLLRSFFRQAGYAVDDVGVAILDPFCADAMSKMVVGRRRVDAFFGGVPVLGVIDAITDRMRLAVERRTPELLGVNGAFGGERSNTRVACAEDVEDTPVAPTRQDWGRRFAARGSSAGRRHASPDQPRRPASARKCASAAGGPR